METLRIDADLERRCVGALRGYEWLADLDDSSVERLLTLGSIEVYEAGEVVVQRGQPPDSVYLLLEGTVIITLGEEGQRVEVARLSPPSCFGEMGILLGRPRSATAVADGRVLVLRLDADTFGRMFELVPGFGLSIARFLAARLEAVMRTF
jgi:CRP/FNR family cyclic AMP-dependent transcriptional regulator